MRHFYRNKLLINSIFVILLTSMTAIISFVILDKIIPLDADGRLKIFILMILAGAAISSIASFVLTARYIKPMNELVTKSQQLADNSGDIQLNFDYEDVSDILNNTIDYLVLSIKERDADIEELRRQIHE